MTTLPRRLARLEARTGNSGPPLTIFVWFVRPDGTKRPVQSATAGSCLYRRAEGEAEDAFRARVTADTGEATGTPSGTSLRVVFLA